MTQAQISALAPCHSAADLQDGWKKLLEVVVSPSEVTSTIVISTIYFQALLRENAFFKSYKVSL